MEVARGAPSDAGLMRVVSVSSGAGVDGTPVGSGVLQT
jgi:hypothetical protein